MSESQSDPQLSSDQEEQVRRLLASARHDEPVPADVAQRLDRVLEQLGSDGEIAPVVDLAARRHRRRQASQVILAAAAVVAVGFGVAHLGSNGAGGGGSSAADSSAVSGRQDAGTTASSPAQDSKDSTAPQASNSSPAPFDSASALAPFQLRADRFGHDVRRAVASSRAMGVSSPSSPSSPSSTGSTGSLESVPSPGCAPAAYGTGTLIPVVYQGSPGVLAVRSERDGTLQVEVLACGTAQVLRSATVPGP